MAQRPAPPPPRLPAPEIVLSGAAADVPLADYGLGDGGVAAERGELRWRAADDGCITAGGVEIVSRSVGVKLTFPSGRELLVGPDGGVHLRDGAVAGPFPAGVELALGDGCCVRIELAQARRDRVRDVEVVDGARALVPWRRGHAVADEGKSGRWTGPRLACCGDGGDLYRPAALGPLLVLERELVATDRADIAPKGRLVVMAGALRESLDTMQRQHREPDALVRRALQAVAAVVEHSDDIFPVGAALPRAEHERPRWSLLGGFELQLDLDGPLLPRLQLFADDAPLPMVEWTLCADAAAYLTNPHEDQIEKRWYGNGTRLPHVLESLQVRDHERDRYRTMQLLRTFTQAPRAAADRAER